MSARVFSKDEIRRIRQTSQWKGPALFVHAVGVVAVAVAVLSWLWGISPIAAIAAWPAFAMVVGARQLGFAVLMHDAAHRALHPNVPLNDALGSLAGRLAFSRLDSYRNYHLKHHANTQQPNDPDLVLSAPFPISRKSLARKFRRDLLGITGFRQRKDQIRSALGLHDPSLTRAQRLTRFRQRYGAVLFTQIAVAVILGVAVHWSAYLFCWLLPFITWQQLATRVRNIAEHAVVPDNDNPLKNTRTMLASPIERVFLAPYMVQFHIEHHLAMWAPCYNLHRAHRFLKRKNLSMETSPSYFHLLEKAASALPGQSTGKRVGPKGGSYDEGYTAPAAALLTIYGFQASARAHPARAVTRSPQSHTRGKPPKSNPVNFNRA